MSGRLVHNSSILKSFEGKTRTHLIELFARTHHRLCCTATPAPNDITEIANHAEFLGVMSRPEMLARFFVHDDQGWRLKGHAREPFYRWLASWGMSLKKPSDLGYPDDGFNLPPLDIQPCIVESEVAPAGALFQVGLKGVTERASVRKATVNTRVAAAVELIQAQEDEPWIAWCGLNEESRELARAIPGAVEVVGADTPERKERVLLDFSEGRVRVLVTKPSIAGHGMNWQHCARMAFVGLSDSYEAYYQAIRRCWRFGQRRAVVAHIVLTEAEEAIYRNVLRKEREVEAMARDLVRHVAEFERAEISEMNERSDYLPAQPMRLPGWMERVA